jgi:hypothetical protein
MLLSTGLRRWAPLPEIGGPRSGFAGRPGNVTGIASPPGAD